MNSLIRLPWTVALVMALFSCGDLEEAKEAADLATDGGPSLASADTIKFVSDVSWLKENFSNLDQASIPWVFGTFLFMQEIAGVKDIPVLFDAAAPPEVKVDLTIQAAGSALLGSRAPVTVYEATDVPVELTQMSALITVDEQTKEYEKIPETVPYVGGKTVYPWYFVISLDQYAWGEAGEERKTAFKDALNAGDMSAEKDSTEQATPVPWYDCETVKISMKYKGAAAEGAFQIETEKYLAADPAVTIALLNQLADGADVLLADKTGFDLAKLKEALAALPPQTCEAPDAADIALFDAN